MIRSTRQRKAILDVLKAEARPLTVTEVHELALRAAPRIGLRTVYRNVRELVEDGKLVGVGYPGQPPRYETVGEGSHKPHLICGLCHKVFELDSGFEAKAICGEIPGFVVEGTETVYYGHCKDPENCPHRKNA
jgi:Fur family transcriptional regulator, ferric uptake regulator